MVVEIQAVLLCLIVGKQIFAISVGVVPAAILVSVVVYGRRDGGAANGRGLGAQGRVCLISVAVAVCILYDGQSRERTHDRRRRSPTRVRLHQYRFAQDSWAALNSPPPVPMRQPGTAPTTRPWSLWLYCRRDSREKARYLGRG